MPDMTATGSARGRDVARARRQALARNGAHASGGSSAPATPRKTAKATARSTPSTAGGREAARQRRESMARGGAVETAPTPVASARSALPAADPGAGPSELKASESARAPSSAPSHPEPAPSLAGLSGRALAQARRALLARSGGRNVEGSSSGSRPGRVKASAAQPAAVVAQTSIAADPEAVSDADLDRLCERVETQPNALGPDSADVRQWCRERRQMVATRGKRGLPMEERKKNRSRQGTGRNGVQPARGREAARMHREDQCRNGRGDSPACRPTGRVRAGTDTAPAKVETGTTLAGQLISGTQVERKGAVTGNEPGSCRVITGTEYVGTEQFAAFCGASPKPGAEKVGRSRTSGGTGVTGTSVGRAQAVTGDEPGACRPVTGTEYLGSERFEEFCNNKGLLAHPEKVAVGATARKGMVVTGSDEARAAAVTGTEPGSARAITGSQYSDAGQARLTINGPQKVALTHTQAGRPVSGTDVGTGIRITGDEAGSCHMISGTEYLSTEQFKGRCGTTPPPAFTDVGVDRSRKGMRITGNLVDRSERVTGNEPGSCRRITGSQYGESEICGGGVDKVQTTETLRGTGVTGSIVGHGPKLTGDEQGGCEPVTGTEYVGREQYAEYCPSTPVAPAGKVDVSESARGLRVSGPPMGRSMHVTGNEPGSALPISGTPYVGREQLVASSTPVRPTMTPAGAHTRRYVAPADAPPSPGFDGMHDATGPAGPSGFSISTPAREGQARRDRITGTGMSTGSRITGPVNKANGLVSGTPEFRHGDEDAWRMQAPATSGAPLAMRSAAAATPAPAYHAGGTPVLPLGPEVPPVGMPEPAEGLLTTDRVTGEGRDSGPRITGDDWARNERVTGTEGRWAQSRNPTQRGMPRGAGANARVHADRERPEVPPARVTGSSGNYGKGPVVTVSGGARG